MYLLTIRKLGIAGYHFITRIDNADNLIQSRKTEAVSAINVIVD